MCKERRGGGQGRVFIYYIHTYNIHAHTDREKRDTRAWEKGRKEGAESREFQSMQY